MKSNHCQSFPRNVTKAKALILNGRESVNAKNVYGDTTVGNIVFSALDADSR